MDLLTVISLLLFGLTVFKVFEPKEQSEESDVEIKEVRAEKEGDILYIFTPDGHFVAQGKTLEEINEVVRYRYGPSCVILISAATQDAAAMIDKLVHK